MSYHARRILKRKERDEFFPPASTAPLVSPELRSSNRILAGYMAHEFLTRGTVFGRKLDPTESSSEQKKNQKIQPEIRTQSYADVAKLLLKNDGAHVADVVNPTELARWIQM